MKPIFCTKSRFVLALSDAALWREGRVHFTREADDPTDLPQTVEFTRDLWEQMGSPTEVTVTVRPGDRLNPEDGG